MTRSWALSGAGVISQWAYGLIRQTQTILLDKVPDDCDLSREIRKSVESDGDSLITDLHIWQVGSNKFAAVISLVAHHPKSPEEYKAPLKQHEELVHVTVEIHRCEADPKDNPPPGRRTIERNPPQSDFVSLSSPFVAF